MASERSLRSRMATFRRDFREKEKTNMEVEKSVSSEARRTDFKKMEKNTIIMVALAVLFVFATVQAVQLTSIKNQLVETGVTVSSGSSGLSVSNSDSDSVSTSSSLDSLPSMVGGC